MTQHYRLILVGFGNVGRAFARLLLKKEQELKTDHDVSFSVTGISTGQHGRVIDTAGIDLERALILVENGESLSVIGQEPFEGDSTAFIRACPGDVLFETTPVNLLSGQPAIEHLKAGLDVGMHVITANKGPVVHGYQMLKALAEVKQRQFLFESAVMDGAPVFALFREPLMGAKLLGFHGILNSCTNLLLDLMAEGKSLEEAITYGQSIGITETDPSNDVDGWDAAIKVAALSTVLMDVPLTPQQVDRIGIRCINQEMIHEAAEAGEKWKLVCSAGYEGGKFTACVAPQRVGADSALYSVSGTSSFVLFELDVLPGLGLLESNPGPETTAFGLLADFLNAVSK
ncbi:MAG: homoserine dehydrogenase [Chloroflexota bacterium]